MLALSRTVVLLVLLFGLAGCGESDNAPVEAPLDTATLAAPGSYGTSFLDVELVDGSRETPANGAFAGAPERRLPARIWYPTAVGSALTDPASDTTFPLIGYGHGFFSNRLEGEIVGPHLASHGYVVISVQFPLSNGGAPGGATVSDLTSQPGDLAFAMAQVENGAAGTALAAAVDTSRRGIAGLSLGGATTLIGSYHPKWHISNIQAAVAYAPASCFFGPGLYRRSLPVLIVTGDRDLLVHPEDGPARALEYAPPPISLVTLHGGNHVGFLGIEDLEGNSDEIGCVVVGAGGSKAVAGAARLAEKLMEGAGPDVAADPEVCMSTCTEVVPQTMTGNRQQELMRAATLAHFEAILRRRLAAQQWLEETLGAQNSDVTVAHRR